MSQNEETILTTVMTAVYAVAGLLRVLSEIESVLSIVLTCISIIAGILVVAVNWEKGKSQIKKWIGK
jgi:hypothetical protein